MIFTKEQIARLPGSRARRNDGTIDIVGKRKMGYPSFVAFSSVGGQLFHALTTPVFAMSGSAITEVLEWADEKHEAQTEPATSGNITTSTTMGFHKVAGVETDPNGFNCLCPLETLRKHQRQMVKHSRTWWSIEKTLALADKALRRQAEETAARLDEADRLRKAARLGLPHARGE